MVLLRGIPPASVCNLTYLNSYCQPSLLFGTTYNTHHCTLKDLFIDIFLNFMRVQLVLFFFAVHYRAWTCSTNHKFEDTWREQQPVELRLGHGEITFNAFASTPQFCDIAEQLELSIRRLRLLSHCVNSTESESLHAIDKWTSNFMK